LITPQNDIGNFADRVARRVKHLMTARAPNHHVGLWRRVSPPSESANTAQPGRGIVGNFTNLRVAGQCDHQLPGSRKPTITLSSDCRLAARSHCGNKEADVGLGL
jgi:hypothetical protein